MAELFTGTYISEVTNKRCDFPFGSKGDVFAVICVQDVTGEIYVKVIPEKLAERLEFEGKILEVYEFEKIMETLLLPDAFLNYLESGEAVILGVGESADILKKSDYDIHLSEFDKITDALDFFQED